MPFEPRIGDRLLSINGLPVEGFLERSKRYIASSTLERLWLELAVNASVQRVDFGPELYQGEVTKGNLRISDVTARLVAQLSDRDDADPANGRLLDWRRTDVSKAMEQGRSYTRPVSFRLRALPRTSDGVMAPAAVHFKGRLVAVFGPLGRAQAEVLEGTPRGRWSRCL